MHSSEVSSSSSFLYSYLYFRTISLYFPSLSPWGFLIVIGLILFIFVDELITVIKILTGNDKSAKEAEDINDIIGRIQSDSADKDEEN